MLKMQDALTELVKLTVYGGDGSGERNSWRVGISKMTRGPDRDKNLDCCGRLLVPRRSRHEIEGPRPTQQPTNKQTQFHKSMSAKERLNRWRINSI
jgi:hypothetical protein